MRENGRGTYRDDGDRTYSVCKRAKQGNQWFPGKPRKLHYKRRGWVVKKGQRKSERERRNSLKKELSEKIKSEEKILRKKQILLPDIL